jgi:hypothetical protein
MEVIKNPNPVKSRKEKKAMMLQLRPAYCIFPPTQALRLAQIPSIFSPTKLPNFDFRTRTNPSDRDDSVPRIDMYRPCSVQLGKLVGIWHFVSNCEREMRGTGAVLRVSEMMRPAFVMS